MGVRTLIALLSLSCASALPLVGCSNDAQKVLPETRGKRGENCQARNDCESGLACLNGICAKNEFGLSVSVKQCDLIECSDDTDCCGDRKTEAPAECAGRDSICTKQNLTGCVSTTCSDANPCEGGGTCRPGICQGTGQAGASCETALDCPTVPNTCTIPLGSTFGTCSLTGFSCSASTPCSAPTKTCSTRTCDCRNPEYDPTAPVCTNADCDNVCLLRCSDNQRCVEDSSCKADLDCNRVGLPLCDGGRCVECKKDADCDEDKDETCEKGTCHKPCEKNEECPLFFACSKKTGDCEYVGCKSDRECILATNRSSDPLPGDNVDTAPVSGSDDPRLYKCLASEGDPDIKTCKIPCENDGSCGAFQTCEAGYCKFVGCESNEECRAYLGVTNQMTSELKPYVATAVCRLAEAEAP